MYKQLLSILLMTISSISLAIPDPTSFPDVPLPAPPIVSLRSLQTSELLLNNNYTQDDSRNTHWEMIDVQTSQFKDERDGGSLIQLRVPDTNFCFAFAFLDHCNNLEATLFSLIPTDTGAIVLKSMEFNACIISPDSNVVLRERCDTTLQGKTQPLTYLWSITPPFGKSKPLIPLNK